MVNKAITQLVDYAMKTGLTQPCEREWAINSILEVLKLDRYDKPEEMGDPLPLEQILNILLDDAQERGLIAADSITERDLLDTALLGRLTPRPAQVIAEFRERYAQSPAAATDWYYQFSQDTNYIRRDRIAKDVKWVTETPYGPMDITINLSKPEKDPRAIAAAAKAKGPGVQTGYPKCNLCRENEGYAGRLDHPARQNHRIIPIQVDGQEWAFQYSPYVYYPEHCIVFNGEHEPMKIDRAAFRKLLDLVGQFPHYFVGSNADLPIVGGSILSHEHFQGGRYTFAMEKAPVETQVSFPGYPDVRAGIVAWPLSVLRLTGADPERVVDLADKILQSWRSYTDESVFIYAETNGVRHNTITPIARRRGSDYELDLALRNNITTEEFPLGYYHPHPALHHIKRENIGLIEVMGLAVLPARLKSELAELAQVLVHGGDLRGSEALAKHAPWAEELQKKYTFTAENVENILRDEVGKVFATCLEHAGVFARTPEGKAAFLRFVEQVK